MIICFPHKPGSGGPGSFQTRFERSLKERGWIIEYKNSATKPDLIFIVGGTRHLLWLMKMKAKRIPIVYRLDGINWLHRKKKVRIKKYILAEYRNLLGKLSHAFIADRIIYQSQFVKNWWDNSGLKKRDKTSIIYNGVGFPQSQPKFDSATIPLLILEGNIDYSPYAIRLLNDLSEKLKDIVTVRLYGKFENKENANGLSKRIDYNGFIQREKVFEVLTGSIYLSLDINPACPNTVIEALACGAPVVAFDTGSLKELVPPEAGIVVPYGSDPWQLAFPDVDALADAILKVKENYEWYSTNARKVAEKRYSIEDMTDKYLEVINQAIKGEG